jgi:hydroxymethylpyrimidine pyrophosphatase-like HAD family hydrolase
MDLKRYKRLFVGVDFDGTIVESAWPAIGTIKPRTVELMDKLSKMGHCIIIWTARSGEQAEQAKQFLYEHDIPFDYFNENPEDPFHVEGTQGRKLHFNLLIDDTAINVSDIERIFTLLEEE